MAHVEGAGQEPRPDPIVGWLEEQNRHSQAKLEDAIRTIELLTQQGRQLGARLDALERSLQVHESLPLRMTSLEATLKQTYESVAALQQMTTEALEQREQHSLVRAAENERERKSIAEMEKRLGDLHQANEFNQSRIKGLADEMRRERASHAQWPSLIEEIAQGLLSLGSRIVQLEEQRKRTESELAATYDRDEQAKADVARIENVQKLSDARWERQAGEWRDQVRSWVTQLADQAKAVQSLASQVARLGEDAQALGAETSQRKHDLDAQNTRLQKIELQMGTLRESGARLEQLAESQRRRADEQGATLFRLEDGLQRAETTHDALVRRVDGHDERLEDFVGQVKALDVRLQQIEQMIVDLQTTAREARSSFAAQIDQLHGRIAMELDRQASHIADLGRAELDERKRRVAQAQQEAQNWANTARQLGVTGDRTG